MRTARLILTLLVAFLALTSQAAAESSPAPPAQVYFPTMRHVWQTRNNCGPSAVAMAASVFGVRIDPNAARWVLRPEPESIGMEAARVPSFVAGYGLMARPRVNGTLDLVRRLLASDVPVIVSQWLGLDQRLEHYRVVVGYDRAAGYFLVHDSTLGPNQWVSDREFLALWIPTGRAYIPVYAPNQAETVARLIGADGDDAGMYRRALDAAIDDVWTAPSDAWAWARVGNFAYAVGDVRMAYTAWQAARTLGLPQGEWWLPGRLALAALDLSDYAAALAHVNAALRLNPSSAGLVYLRGRALQGLGDTGAAQAAFTRALELEPTFGAARAALESVMYLRAVR